METTALPCRPDFACERNASCFVKLVGGIDLRQWGRTSELGVLPINPQEPAP
jgi:hypothetical protein